MHNVTLIDIFPYTDSTRWIMIAHTVSQFQVSSNVIVQWRFNVCTSMCCTYAGIVQKGVRGMYYLCRCKTEESWEIAKDLQVLHGNEKKDTNSFIWCSVIMVSAAWPGTLVRFMFSFAMKVCMCVSVCVKRETKKAERDVKSRVRRAKKQWGEGVRGRVVRNKFTQCYKTVFCLKSWDLPQRC